MNTRLTLAALFTAAALLPAGCVADNTTPAREGGPYGGAADINPRAAADIRDGGRLRIAATSFPDNFNQLHLDGNTLDTANILAPVMPSTITSNPAGEVFVDHDYFTDIKLTGTSPQQITYTINPNAVWSDGSPITWEDLRAEASALTGRDDAYLIASTSGFERVRTVERGVDDRQAVVTFNEPYGSWQGMFSPLYPKEVTSTPEAFNSACKDGLPRSAGPFVITSIDKGQGRITLSRNPRWWGDRPKLDAITFSVIDAAAQVPALLNKEVDATVYSLETLNDVAMAKSSPDIQVRQAAEPGFTHITFNGAPSSVLHDPKLRVAVAKAIDRETIVKAMLNGLVADPKPLNNHVFVNGQKGFRNNAQAVEYNPEQAARELDALGWTLRDGVRVKDGRPLVIQDALAQNPLRVSAAKIIRENLAKLGIKLVINTYPSTGFFKTVINPGRFDIAQFGWSGSIFPIPSLRQIYYYDPKNPQGNAGRIGTDSINRLIVDAVGELDPKKAISMANDADKQLFDIGFSVPLYQYPASYPVRKNLANFGAFGLASVDYTKVGFTK